MSERNRSPVGFGAIILLHVFVLASGVFLQNVHDRWPGLFQFVLAAVLVSACFAAWLQRRFLWDVFRSFKSAVVLLSFLALSCVLGTLIIQDLDLRRDRVFALAGDDGVDGKPPPFDERRQPTRFALAESWALMRLLPDEHRDRMMREKVKLSPVEDEMVALRREAFGDRSADAFRDAVLGSKRRNVDELASSAFAQRHYATLHKAFVALKRIHLFDIFEAWWFYALLGLIGVNVIGGTTARAPWNVRDFGLAITHSGIIIILTGALLDRLAAKEGYIYFTYGKPEAQVAAMIGDEKSQTYHHLPFPVRLDRFATEYYHEFLIRRVDWSRRHDGGPWSENDPDGAMPFHVWDQVAVREGVPRDYEGGKVRLTVHRYRPRVQVRTEVGDVEGGPLRPAVKAGLYIEESGGPNYFIQGNAEPWLFASDPERSAREISGLRFEYVWARDENEYRRLLAETPMPDNGTLFLRAGQESARVPVVLGSGRRVRLGERSLEVAFEEIRSALAGEENVNLDRRLQRREEPVLYLKVNGRPVPVPRDDRLFTEGHETLDGVAFRFDWPNPRDSGVFRIYRILEGPGCDRSLVQMDERGEALAAPMELGRRVPLEGVGGFLAAEA
ncbi:MAG: cytochrome c biogenesis protein ResB, partial [Planctomycetota bacterium]